jgi:hypothetical protein
LPDWSGSAEGKDHVVTALVPNGGAPVIRKRIAQLEIDGRLEQTLDLGAPSVALLRPPYSRTARS